MTVRSDKAGTSRHSWPRRRRGIKQQHLCAGIAKVCRKLVNVIMIPRVFSNWPIVMFNVGLIILGLNRNSVGKARIRGGPTFYLRHKDLTDYGSLIEIYGRHVYGSPLMSPDGAVVIDIGASIGDFALSICRTGKPRILIFEPQQQALDLLVQNIERNGFGHLVTLFPIPVGSCVGLNEIFEANDITRCELIKCDCEGDEYTIFNETSPEILRRIQRISMECHDNGQRHALERLHAPGSGRNQFGMVRWNDEQPVSHFRQH